MAAKLTMKSGTHLEFGVGKVTAGKEQWMFGEYFPAVGPALNEHGFQRLCSFAVVATNTEGVAPVQGSLCTWPSAEHRARFQQDPRFVKVKTARDEALDVMSDGHLFQPVDAAIDLDTDADYALVIADADPLDPAPILDLPLATDSVSQTYSGKSMRLHPWSDEAERLLAGPPAAAAVFRIRVHPPTG